jgi:hypothetical protein
MSWPIGVDRRADTFALVGYSKDQCPATRCVREARHLRGNLCRLLILVGSRQDDARWYASARLLLGVHLRSLNRVRG